MGVRVEGMLDALMTRATFPALADAAAGTGGGREVPRLPIAEREPLASWLVARDLAGPALTLYGDADPGMAAALRPAALGAAAANLSHYRTLELIERRFAHDAIPMVLLKGASVADSAYADRSLRAMTDLDIWLLDRDMDRAAAALGALGFRHDAGLAHRPRALQRLSAGEWVFRPASGRHGLVELHFGPIQGWWARRTAAADAAAMWDRAERMGPDRHARRLAIEDAVIQTAIHAIANQFGQAPLRCLLDLAVLARRCPVAWDVVAGRAKAWRLATATWLVLHTAHGIYGLPGADVALARLRPSATRRTLLRAFVSPASVVAGRDLTRPSRRHAFLLALADRRRDAAQLLARTVWPEPWWIQARYGAGAGRAAHLWTLVRRGEV